MSVINLDKIFQPRSIAVVGASEKPGSIGNALMRNLIERGFSGEIHPINPNHPRICKA
ncbi:MAG: CoA-binding protein [Desulfobacterales bacterium]|jgi:acetyltransferase